jgi:hypothetical protein
VFAGDTTKKKVFTWFSWAENGIFTVL